MSLDTNPYALPPASPRERLIEFSVTLHTLTPRIFVTHLLVAANVIVFVLMVLNDPGAITAPQGPTLVAFGANFGPKTLNGEYWRLFTSMFVHIGVLHIALNMWVLWMIGRLMERVVGNVGFLLLYVASGLCGSLASVAFNPYVLSAGASGAVFGLIGGMLGFLVLGRGSMPAEVVKDLRSSGTAFVGYNLVFGFIVRGIDNAAHIGGLLAGCLCGLVLGQQLTLARPVYRWPRNLLVLLLGTAITAGGISILPPPPDLGPTVQAAMDAQQEAGRQYQQLKARWSQAVITNAQLADSIEQEVLPRGREALRKIEGITRPPPYLRELLSAYQQYLQQLVELWEYEVAMLRDPATHPDAEFEKREQAATAALEAFHRAEQAFDTPK
jgi:rhomboid protease GluP